ncbi:hypothetical protein VPH35_051663 [Triticum aestivum]
MLTPHPTEPPSSLHRTPPPAPRRTRRLPASHPPETNLLPLPRPTLALPPTPSYSHRPTPHLRHQIRWFPAGAPLPPASSHQPLPLDGDHTQRPRLLAPPLRQIRLDPAPPSVATFLLPHARLQPGSCRPARFPAMESGSTYIRRMTIEGSLTARCRDLYVRRSGAARWPCVQFVDGTRAVPTCHISAIPSSDASPVPPFVSMASFVARGTRVTWHDHPDERLPPPPESAPPVLNGELHDFTGYRRDDHDESLCGTPAHPLAVH